MRRAVVLTMLLGGCASLEAPPGTPPKVVAYCEDRAELAATTPYGGLAAVADLRDKREAAFRACLYEEGY